MRPILALCDITKKKNGFSFYQFFVCFYNRLLVGLYINKLVLTYIILI